VLAKSSDEIGIVERGSKFILKDLDAGFVGYL
jgi:hypothetical protein